MVQLIEFAGLHRVQIAKFTVSRLAGATRQTLRSVRRHAPAPQTRARLSAQPLDQFLAASRAEVQAIAARWSGSPEIGQAGASDAFVPLAHSRCGSTATVYR